MDEGFDFIPLSMLNAVVYCERRFYYEFVLGEMLMNHHVLEGQLRHEEIDVPGYAHEGEVLQQRRLTVFSRQYRLTGIIDLLETAEDLYRVVEYKKGRVGDFLCDQVQLCAQALCIEEVLGVSIPAGEVFYFASRKRFEVVFTPELRRQTEVAIGKAHEVALRAALPGPLTSWKKCRECLLEPLCLPRETLQLQRELKGV